MSFMRNIFGKDKPLAENKNHAGVKSLLRDESARLPSFPSSSKNPLRLYRVEDFHIALLVNAEPIIHEQYGNAVVPLCLLAVNSDCSIICSYSAQYLLPNKPPYHVIWQPNGQLQVNPNPFKSLVSPDVFLKAYFTPLLRDLGFSDSVEVTEMTLRPD